MPLKAKLDKRTILSFSLPSDLSWKQVQDAARQGRVMMSCCGVPAIPKTMHAHGTRFFAHKSRPHTCEWGSESQEHEMYKIVAALAAMAVGWKAETEETGPGWRADVLARKGNERVAIEIQWSPQTKPQTYQRTYRYREDNVRVLWLFRKKPAGLGIDPMIPAFEIVDHEQVATLVKRYLTGDLVWNPRTLQGVPATLVGYDLMCTKCGTIWHKAPFYIRKAFRFDRQDRPWFVGDTQKLLQTEEVTFLHESDSDHLGRNLGFNLIYCPTCRKGDDDVRLPESEVLLWPHAQVDFMDMLPRRACWSFPRRTPKPFSPTSTAAKWRRVLFRNGLLIDPDDLNIWGPDIRAVWKGQSVG